VYANIYVTSQLMSLDFGVSQESMAVYKQEIISSNKPFSIYLYLPLMSSVLAKAVAVKS